jgi:hypothetical protein
MTRTRLSDKVGAALDPRAAIRVSFHPADGGDEQIGRRTNLTKP